MNRPRVVALLLAATTLATACAGQSTNRSSATTSAPTPVVSLSSVDQFATIFNADRGVPRLILPISPT